MTEPDWPALDAAWIPARRAGVLGGVTTEALIEHAAGYLPAACRVEEKFTGIDLGTGAGVPGVILAALRPSSTWTLVDGNERRCEYAQSAVRAMGMGERVRVLHARVEDVGHDRDYRASFDLVVARLFGPPPEVAECAVPLLAAHGRLVVSAGVQAMADWNAAADVAGLAVEPRADAHGSRYVTVTRSAPVDSRWPRRRSARLRSPIF